MMSLNPGFLCYWLHDLGIVYVLYWTQYNNNINSRELCNTLDVSGSVLGALHVLTH